MFLSFGMPYTIYTQTPWEVMLGRCTVILHNFLEQVEQDLFLYIDACVCTVNIGNLL